MMIDSVETAPSCEAADRNKQALHELDCQWGSRQLDYGKLRRILTGDQEGDDHGNGAR